MDDESTERAISATLAEIGARLRAVRTAWKLSQAVVSESVRVDQSQWSRWERGVEEPSLARVMEFARKYRVSMEFICYGIPVRTNPDILAQVAQMAPATPSIVIRPNDTDWDTGRGRT